MARPFRLQYPGAFYHVMNRGRNKQQIFHSQYDYENFIKCIEESHSQFAAKFHAFCIMPNHYHLFIETPQANLARIMRHINGTYTQRYHKKYGTDGSIFKGRYKSILVDSEAYALDLTAYIHRNPISGTQPLVEHLSDFKWSSYQTYFIEQEAFPWISTEYVNALCQKEHGHIDHMNRNKVAFDFDAFYEQQKVCNIIGSNEFKSNLVAQYFSSDIEGAIQIYGRPDIQFIIQYLVNRFGCKYKDIIQGMPSKKYANKERKLAIILSHILTGSTYKILAEQFNLSENSLPNIANKAKSLFTKQEILEIGLDILKRANLKSKIET